MEREHTNIGGVVYKRQGKIYYKCFSDYCKKTEYVLFDDETPEEDKTNLDFLKISLENTSTKITQTQDESELKILKEKKRIIAEAIKKEKQQYIKKVMGELNFTINDLPRTHSQRYLTKSSPQDAFETIEFDDVYINRNTFICSPMGTGKTELVEHYLKTKFDNKNILYITF